MKKKLQSQTLERTTFTTSRILEFFSEKELTMQIGHDKDKWGIAILKELIDNSLDGCEKANTQPHINILVTPNSFSVSDNGSGLPEETIKKSLDYITRTSDKSHYISPTRGQLGNALKCVYALPFVADGEGRVEIETSGKRYTINITLDRIGQKPEITLSQSESKRTEGVKITIFYQDSSRLLEVSEKEDFYNPPLSIPDLLAAYSTFNPHATFSFEDERLEATAPKWNKWNPSNPTSAHWYSIEELRNLIAAYLSNKKDKTIREFVSEFRGLSGTHKQQMITALSGLHGKLTDLAVEGDIDVTKIQKLFSAMRQETQPVKPNQLGVIG